MYKSLFYTFLNVEKNEIDLEKNVITFTKQIFLKKLCKLILYNIKVIYNNII